MHEPQLLHSYCLCLLFYQCGVCFNERQRLGRVVMLDLTRVKKKKKMQL